MRMFLSTGQIMRIYQALEHGVARLAISNLTRVIAAVDFN